MQFSIAIPVFRQEKFISSALSSIRAQSVDVQLSIMDATPGDSIQSILEGHRGVIAYRRHGGDDGQAAAIQEGWDNTHGEILGWLCADDYLFPDALQAVEMAFREDPDLTVVYGDAIFVDEGGRFLGYFPAIARDASGITRGCCICQPSCFARREAVEAVGGLNPKLHYIMDWDLWTKLYVEGAKFRYLQTPLSVVRMYRGTKTASRSLRRFAEIARHLRRHASIGATIRSLLGFYFQDIATQDVSGVERVILKGLSRYQQRRRRRLLDLIQEGYGISRDNVIDSTAEVVLPWYEDKRPDAIWVECDLSDPPEVSLDGSQLQLKTGTRFCYSMASADSKNILRIKLSSRESRAWRLRTLWIE